MQAVQNVLESFSLARSPYFEDLRAGCMARDDFVETQVQFYYAVVFFSRPMAVLGARIPSPELRIEVMRNVWEEHGEGNPAGFHATTFRDFLMRLDGIDLAAIETHVLWPEVRAFNTALSGCALLDDWEVGTACFAMIERMFVDASSWIATALSEQGWLPRDQIVHYAVHETLDVKHADDFIQVLHAGTDGSVQAQRLIEQGLRLGGYLFRTLYDGLHTARTRRERATGPALQPHIYRSS